MWIRACFLRFLSTPSARRATAGIKAIGHRTLISIHALREEGDLSDVRVRQQHGNFYPRPPRGGRRTDKDGEIFGYQISIHALREEGDRRGLDLSGLRHISIHALREEGDSKNRDKISIFL